MKLRLLAVGTRPPPWIVQGFDEYARRMPPHLPLELIEVPPGRHRDPHRRVREEGERLLGRIGPGDRILALDVGGRTWSTEELAESLENWVMDGRDVSFLVGGAEGLAPVCFERADQVLSLSALTFPHLLVRVLLAEQLYRAWTLTQGHPYHRG